MEKNARNRVAEGLNNWLANEKHLKSIFGNDVVKEKHFLKSKMDFFTDLHKNVKPVANSNERVLLNIIKGEADKIGKIIYPNPITRLFINVSAFIKEHAVAWKQNQQVFNSDLLSFNTNNKATAIIKSKSSTPKVLNARVDQSPQQIYFQQQKQSTGLKKEKEDKALVADSKSLLPRNRVNNGKGQGIH